MRKEYFRTYNVQVHEPDVSPPIDRPHPTDEGVELLKIDGIVLPSGEYDD